jgi:gamma-butyrobetaine dioxygenase
MSYDQCRSELQEGLPMPRITEARIIEAGKAVRLVFADGRSARFHAVWLRDNAPDAQTRSPGNGQRLITVLDIPEDIGIAAATPSSDGGLRLRFAPEGKEVAYPAAFLAAGIYDGQPAQAPGWTDGAIERWDAALQQRLPVAAYDAVRLDRQALGAWLAAVRRYGFAVLTGVPTRPGSLCQVAGLFGYVRETNYGRWFDVRAEVDPSNLAYTNLDLQAHTDNPYRDPVPTLQLLACLENTVAGGDSVVVDGFKAAEILQRRSPRGFDLLTRHCARFEYAGSPGVRLRAKRPILELGPDGELIAIRFNNRSAAAFTDIPYAAMADYYAAYRELARIIEDPANAVTFKLAPGELFIVDNTRVLHARKSFSGIGKRWLQGCYADKDGLLSTLAAIENETREAAA